MVGDTQNISSAVQTLEYGAHQPDGQADSGSTPETLETRVLILWNFEPQNRVLRTSAPKSGHTWPFSVEIVDGAATRPQQFLSPRISMSDPRDTNTAH